MNFIVVGANGRMGKAVICELKNSKDNYFGVDIDKSEKVVIDIFEIKEKCHALIDFSVANDRTKYIEYCKQNKLMYACFSTNVSNEDLAKLKELSNLVPVIICKNSSVMMNIMFKIISMISKKLKHADVLLTDVHHKFKKDSPSGTAKQILKIVENTNKNVQINVARVGNVVGTHEISFFLDDEILTIKHTAYSKRIFAIGAIKIVKTYKNKKCGLFEI